MLAGIYHYVYPWDTLLLCYRFWQHGCTCLLGAVHNKYLTQRGQLRCLYYFICINPNIKISIIYWNQTRSQIKHHRRHRHQIPIMKYFHGAFIAWGNFYNQKKKRRSHKNLFKPGILLAVISKPGKEESSVTPLPLATDHHVCVTSWSVPQHTRGCEAGWDELPLNDSAIITAVIITAAPEAPKAKAKLQELCPPKGFSREQQGNTRCPKTIFLPPCHPSSAAALQALSLPRLPRRHLLRPRPAWTVDHKATDVTCSPLLGNAALSGQQCFKKIPRLRNSEHSAWSYLPNPRHKKYFCNECCCEGGSEGISCFIQDFL